ncbi:MAG: sigma-70 family RNA polymerase sigma factor [Planctomycetales bacterium]|nr:sigma-70 family RNA polymerase sigma factor [Planctomycetales bacterium]MCA9168339.1 sigma-70 family RNA polymerase sigma factor [Planctomycetales bacterium]
MDMKSEELTNLFERYRTRLRRMVDLRLDWGLRGRIDVSDIVQEAFLEAHRRRDDFDPAQMPSYLWLRMIVGQKLIDLHRYHVRAQKRSVLRESPLGVAEPSVSSVALAHELADGATSVVEAAIRAERARMIETALLTMDDLDREVLALRHFEMLSNADAAHVLGISPNAASNRYVRALKRLRELISPVDP